MRLIRDDTEVGEFFRRIFPRMAKDQLWELSEGDAVRLCECDCASIAGDGSPSGVLCGRVGRYVNAWVSPKWTEPDEMVFCAECWQTCATPN